MVFSFNDRQPAVRTPLPRTLLAAAIAAECKVAHVSDDPSVPLLTDADTDRLVSLVLDSFRVRPNHDPVYVDIGGHLSRIAAPQHQVIFGRRGSGKSCLLVHFYRHAQEHDSTAVFIEGDVIKRLSFPDVLIRLLLEILTSLPGADSSWFQRLLRRQTQLQVQIAGLNALLDMAQAASVRQQTTARSGRRVEARGSFRGVGAGLDASREQGSERTAEFVELKLEHLERHLPDYRALLTKALDKSGTSKLAVIVDDFYLIRPADQPDVVDYLHRLTRGTSAYLKIGTVRHRTSLVRYDAGQTVGVEIAQDLEGVDLDQTLADVERTKAHLAVMFNSMAETIGIHSATSRYFSPDGLLALTLASGGVPRDYLNVFAEAVPSARSLGLTARLTPRAIYKGAARVSYRDKLATLRSDAGHEAETIERVFQDLLSFCLKEKRKTGFLVSQDEARAMPEEHEIIKQLMDFRLVHVVEPDTSAASGRPGRYEAYTLDFAFFMEPRRRFIDHMRFWDTDEQRRRRGLREAPTYPLARVRDVIAIQSDRATEDIVAEIDEEIGIEPDDPDAGDEV